MFFIIRLLSLSPNLQTMKDINQIIGASGAPFNREERFFTGTILSLLFSGNDFRDLKHITDIMAPELGLLPEYSAESKNILFYTEYNLKKSRYVTGEALAIAEDVDGDTPDVLFYVSDGAVTYLFAIEVKMYHRPTFDNLAFQMQRQRIILNRLAEVGGIKPEHIFHSALIPAKQAKQLPNTLPIITWERLLDIYSSVSANAYAIDVLKYGLEQYDKLVATQSSGKNNSTETLLGMAIFKNHKNIGIKYVGCGGGLKGQRFVRFASTEKWRYNKFQVTTSETCPNANWFTIDDFINAVNWDAPTEDN